MTIRILEEPKYFVHRCMCGTIFEFEEEDLRPDQQFGGWVIYCPKLCGGRFYTSSVQSLTPSYQYADRKQEIVLCSAPITDFIGSFE